MIHQYKLNGYNIVLDVNSGSVHYVDDVCYDIIRSFSAAKDAGEEPDRTAVKNEILNKYPEETSETVDAAFRDIDELESAGLVYAKRKKNPLECAFRNRVCL